MTKNIINKLCNVLYKLASFMKKIIIIFIFLSWCITFIGTDDTTIRICFILSVLLASSNIEESIFPATLGALILPAVRSWFLIPRNYFLWIHLSKPLTWWDNQTACAGVVTWILAMIIPLIIKGIRNRK